MTGSRPANPPGPPVRTEQGGGQTYGCARLPARGRPGHPRAGQKRAPGRPVGEAGKFTASHARALAPSAAQGRGGDEELHPRSRRAPGAAGREPGTVVRTGQLGLADDRPPPAGHPTRPTRICLARDSSAARAARGCLRRGRGSGHNVREFVRERGWRRALLTVEGKICVDETISGRTFLKEDAESITSTMKFMHRNSSLQDH
jgi:hypothetical protein